MSGTLVDANVILDVITSDSMWGQWSEEHLRRQNSRGPLFINPIVYAEVAPAFESSRAMEEWFAFTVFERRTLPFEAAWPAARAFAKYRAAGGARRSPLPDFYIGAHAEVEDLTLVTRDAARYRTYFPTVRLITP